MLEQNPLIQQRLQKLSSLKQIGYEFPYSFKQENHAAELLKKYKKDQKVAVAGRIMLLRNMGKIAFSHVQDVTGQIQVYFKEDDLKNYKILKHIEIGDWVGVKGFMFKTKTGEITVHAKSFELLTKTVRPLAEKWHGLKDKEARYRQRYVDLAVNKEVKEVFMKRTKIIASIREFLDSQGFIEVEIPYLQPVYGGANARPFKTHINAWNMDLFLSISPELYLKRLIVGGLEKVYTIGKCFRNEGADKTHNPEFTSLEFYGAYMDYNDMMDLTERLWEHVAKKVLGTTKFKYQGKTFDVKRPWKRITMYDALKKYAALDIKNLSDEDLKKLLSQKKIEIPSGFNRGLAITALFEELVEDKLVGPVHIIDHPKETSPLCRAKRGNPELIERVEPYINGWELGNGYSELNDSFLQEKFFKEQEKRAKGGDEEAQKMDEDYVKALEFGMPPTGGMGIGIDRMVMLLTDSESIRDVILFPTMKPELDQIPKL